MKTSKQDKEGSWQPSWPGKRQDRKIRLYLAPMKLPPPTYARHVVLTTHSCIWLPQTMLWASMTFEKPPSIPEGNYRDPPHWQRVGRIRGNQGNMSHVLAILLKSVFLSFSRHALKFSNCYWLVTIYVIFLFFLCLSIFLFCREFLKLFKTWETQGGLVPDPTFHLWAQFNLGSFAGVDAMAMSG